jgi:hypothetical protein
MRSHRPTALHLSYDPIFPIQKESEKYFLFSIPQAFVIVPENVPRRGIPVTGAQCFGPEAPRNLEDPL